MLDVGIGVGLFGILLVIVWLDLCFVLFDSNGKKICFVCYVCWELGFFNVEVVNICVEQYCNVLLQIISWVFVVLLDMLWVLVFLIIDGSCVLVMKVVVVDQELVGLFVGWYVRVVFLLVFGLVEVCVLVIVSWVGLYVLE